MPFSLAQQTALAVLPKLSGLISMLLSMKIVYTVLRDPKRRSKAYHRLILGISASDISASFWLSLSTWPIPRESGVLWAVGNNATCNLQGFFTQAGIASVFYNASLSIYFLLVIKHGWKESQVKAIEKWLHGIPIAWATISAVLGLGLHVFGNANLWCWVKPTSNTFRWAAFYGPLWIMIVIITVLFILILVHVRRVEVASARRQRNTMLEFSGHMSSQGSSQISQLNTEDQSDRDFVTEEVYEDVVLSRRTHDTATATNMAPPNNSPMSVEVARKSGQRSRSERFQTSQLALKRTRQVARQSFLFAGAFYINWIALSITRLLQTVNNQVYFPLLLIAAVTVPIQGLPNFLVYLAPGGGLSLCSFLRCTMRNNGQKKSGQSDQTDHTDEGNEKLKQVEEGER